MAAWLHQLISDLLFRRDFGWRSMKDIFGGDNFTYVCTIVQKYSIFFYVQYVLYVCKNVKDKDAARSSSTLPTRQVPTVSSDDRHDPVNAAFPTELLICSSSQDDLSIQTFHRRRQSRVVKVDHSCYIESSRSFFDRHKEVKPPSWKTIVSHSNDERQCQQKRMEAEKRES